MSKLFNHKNTETAKQQVNIVGPSQSIY